MSKFIEFTEDNGNRLAINREEVVAFGQGESVEGKKGIGINTKDGNGWLVTESYDQVKHLVETGSPLDNGKLYRIPLGDYYIGLSKPDNKLHIAYNSEDTKYYQRIFTLPQIYKLDPRLLPLAIEDKGY